MVNEAQMKQTGNGMMAVDDGWYILHAEDARWFHHRRFGTLCRFEGEVPFPAVGMNLRVLEPGQPACLYHREDAQENFFVLAGECTLIIENEKRALRAGHFVHCPPQAHHVFVGAGDGPCAILAVGHRPAEQGLLYPVNATAAEYGASVEQETDDPDVAYAGAERAPIAPRWPLR